MGSGCTGEGRRKFKKYKQVEVDKQIQDNGIDTGTHILRCSLEGQDFFIWDRKLQNDFLWFYFVLVLTQMN